MVVRHPLTRFVGSWDDLFCQHCSAGHEIIAENPTLGKMLESDDSEYMISLPNLVNFAVQDRRYV